MAIEFHCNHCGKPVRAPDDAGGKRGRCPSCHQSIYIPTPSDKIEPLEFTPDDPSEEERERRLLQESRDYARKLAADRETGAGGPAHDTRSDAASEVLPPHVDVETLVIEYAAAMASGDLATAEEMATELHRNMPAAEEVIQRILLDEMPPRQLADIPRPVLNAFFKQLRGSA